MFLWRKYKFNCNCNFSWVFAKLSQILTLQMQLVRDKLYQNALQVLYNFIMWSTACSYPYTTKELKLDWQDISRAIE